jgi:hypothetical protein
MFMFPGRSCPTSKHKKPSICAGRSLFNLWIVNWERIALL